MLKIGGSAMDAIKDCVDSITDAYRCIHKGFIPNHSARDLATHMLAVLCRNVSSQDESCLLCALSFTATCCHVSMSELTCITLTLVDQIHGDLMSQTLQTEMTLYLSRIHQLFQEAHVMSKLVHQFHGGDRMIRHLAAKCVSTYVSFQLHSGEINQIWKQTCVQAFHGGPTCKELDPCMWSFTSVFKGLLKDSQKGKRENFQNLLLAFDPHLTILVSHFLPGEEMDDGSSAVNLHNNAHSWGVTFSCLLDLLELLSASRLMSSTSVCQENQRLPYTRARALIRTTASPSCEYFLKRKALLLMKRTLLQKAGEDLNLRDVSTAVCRDEHLGVDMATMAETVLSAVSANWLHFVPVETGAASFGGYGLRPQQGGSRKQKPDHVMLRAVSLVVVKSLELAFQTGPGAACTVEVALMSLFGFLRNRGVPLTASSHLCCWYVLVFSEQDDDMTEAAKTLLTLYLRNNSGGQGSNPEAVSATPCSSGFNPHCHFLFFLRSVSFDPSTLLDFLISSETCFLEYLVRYLKHLRGDFPGFLLACGNMDESDPFVRAQPSFSSPRDAAASVPVVKSCPDGTSRSALPTAHTPAGQTTGLGSDLCLVDYSSSEESGAEDMEVSRGAHMAADEGDTRVKSADSEKHGSRCSNMKHEKHTVPTPVGHILADQAAQMQTVVVNHGQGRSTPCSSLAASGRLTALARTPGSRTLTRSLLCLSDLKRVVAKLHAKNLFPYNPKSLLKLLTQAEHVHLSHVAANI